MEPQVWWEYLVLSETDNGWTISSQDKVVRGVQSETGAKLLNEYGKQGWELVSVAMLVTGFQGATSSNRSFYLKRPRRD